MTATTVDSPVLITELKDDPTQQQQQSWTLPRGGQMAVIAEAIVREAPFAGGSSRGEWRELLQTPAFEELSSEGFRWFNTHVIGPRDAGEDVGLEGDTSRDPFGATASVEDVHFSLMASNYVALFRRVPRERKDYFFRKFHEAMAYGIILVIGAAYPRRRDALSEDLALKRHIINLCAEWTTGIRPSTLPDDHWIVRGEARSARAAAARRMSSASPKSTTVDSVLAAGSSVASALSPPATSPRTSRKRDTLVHATYTLHHSPFFRHHLEKCGARPAERTKLKVGLTIGATRVPHFVANHVEDKAEALRRVKRAIRVAPKPLPVSYVLSNSGVARRSAMEDHARRRLESKTAAQAFQRECRSIAAQIEVDQNAVLASEDLREFATTLAKNTGRNQPRTTVSSTTTTTTAADGGRNTTTSRPPPAAAAAVTED
ncbi:hypothetical protein CTAYLR_002493 [Chrysophaeum taylorii]|uniref:Uncharacterized protein n=1 Tax=Chrysophaeum taylorii TaxID=2483200 RepID=A0AAD7XLC1_9STRA|nr:hypothetical protein CTAYLR_002493 [Chrysophaeum taylorii]